jgi:hypothetical protein
MRRRRIMTLALIALVVPFPALALDGGEGDTSSSPASLNVTASLAGCGLAGSQIMCQINAGWNSLEGAENYSVSVIGADGSVMDVGSVTGQGTSVSVPYTGSGTYTVQVTAWGTPPGEEEDGTPEVIARSTSDEGENTVSRTPPEASGGELRQPQEAAPVTDDALSIPGDGVDPRDEPVCEEPAAEVPPVPPAPEAAPEAPEASDGGAAAEEREVVDTIPADGNCTE